MRFARQRLGLILWLCIALLVLLVPVWRLRANHQWKSSVIDILLSPSVRKYEAADPSNGFGLSSRMAQETARQFPDDVNAQLAQIRETDFMAKYNAAQKPYLDYFSSDAVGLKKAQKKWLQGRPLLRKLTDEYFARYDALEHRFPDSNMVRAQRLRDTMAGTIIKNQGLLSPPPLTFWADPWLSPAGHAAALHTAKEGARHEPDNAFFPWMEAILYFSVEQNDDALHALETAGKCPHFRDYGLKTTALRLDMLRSMRATGWEDDFTEYALFPFPHFAGMRSAARAAVGQIQLAHQRGDSERAFRFAVAVSRAGAVVAQSGDNTLISSLVGQAICAIIWQGAAEGVPGAPPKTPISSGSPQQIEAQYAARRQKLATLLASQARQRGQNALAREIEQQPKKFDAQKLSVWVTSNPNGLIPRIERLMKIYWLGSQILRLTLISALMWFLCWVVTRRYGVALSPIRAQMLIPAMFCVGVTGPLLLGAGTLSPALQEYFCWLAGTPPSPEPAFPISILRYQWATLIALVWVFLIGIETIRGREKKSSSLPINRKEALLRLGRGLVWCVFVVCVFIIFLFPLEVIPPGAGSDVLFFGSLMVVLLSALLASGLSLWRPVGHKRIVAACAAGTLWLGITAKFLASGAGDMGFYSEIMGIVALLLALATLVLAMRIWKISFKAFNMERFMIRLLAHTRVAMGTLTLAGMVSYLAVALWTIPLEHSTRTLLGRVLQEGEVTVLREQVQK